MEKIRAKQKKPKEEKKLQRLYGKHAPKGIKRDVKKQR